MRIVELKAENVKRIKAIKIVPKGNVIMISGKNGQGKTSALDSIWFALEGRASGKVKKVIRDGEKKAKVELKIDGLKVTRTWSDKGKTYLKVENAEGFEVSSPQSLLDDFIGKLSFDPLEFSRMRNAEQRDVLLDSIGLREQLEEIILKHKRLYDERRDIGRDLKTAQANVEELEPDDIDDIPDKPIDVEKLEKERDELESKQGEVSLIENDIMNIRGRIKRLEDELKSARNELEKAEKSLSKLPEVDMLMDKRGKLQSEISKAIGVNAKIEEKTRYLSIKEKASSLEDEYDEMSEKISGLEKEKVALLKKADMPINGLSIDDEGVLYKGIPFGQLASSEQLKVSLAIAISLNPELRVLRITDGSLLDEDNLKLISDIAGKTDYQIWIEKVDESGEVGIFIEDGEIKKNNYK